MERFRVGASAPSTRMRCPKPAGALAAAADSRKDARRDRAKVASGWEGDS